MAQMSAGLHALKGAVLLLLGGAVVALGSGHDPSRSRAPMLGALPRLSLGIQRVSLAPLAGAEIVCFDHQSGRVFATCAPGLAQFRLLGDGQLVYERMIQPAGPGGAGPDSSENLSHVTVDPARRGVLACSVLPADAAGVAGSVAIISVETGETLARVSVGFNPDAVSFTPDGALLVVVNEGEPRTDAKGVISDPPGSLSVIATGRPKTAEGFRGLTQGDVRTVYPSAAALAGASSSRPVRIHPRNRTTPTLDLEPESVAIGGRRAYITLQENNAIGVFDLETMEWERIEGLGFPERIIDAVSSDHRIGISTRCRGMPMPDQLGLFRIGTGEYLLTADEGDTRGRGAGARPGLGDEATIGDLADAGRLSPRALAALTPAERELQVCAFFGVLDGGGKMSAPLMFGARSATVWDAQTLEPLSSTGSEFERLMARLEPSLFNASGADAAGMDQRSARRGPEPEGVAIGAIDGRPVGFITLERPGAIAALDLSDPRRVRIIGFEVCASAGQIGPEGILFIPAAKSPTGEALLIVAFETSGHVASYRLTPVSLE